MWNNQRRKDELSKVTSQAAASGISTMVISISFYFHQKCGRSTSFPRRNELGQARHSVSKVLTEKWAQLDLAHNMLDNDHKNCGARKSLPRRKDELDRQAKRKVLTEKWPQLDLAHNKQTNKSGLQTCFLKTGTRCCKQIVGFTRFYGMATAACKKEQTKCPGFAEGHHHESDSKPPCFVKSKSPPVLLQAFTRFCTSV